LKLEIWPSCFCTVPPNFQFQAVNGYNNLNPEYPVNPVKTISLKDIVTKNEILLFKNF